MVVVLVAFPGSARVGQSVSDQAGILYVSQTGRSRGAGEPRFEGRRLLKLIRCR